MNEEWLIFLIPGGVILIMTLLVYLLRYTSSGNWGEKMVVRQLSKLGDEYKVFNDVLIRTSKGTSQIDHIVVSPYGIFVIETKDYSGWIFGNENSGQWTKTNWGKKYHFYNPIKQNLGHVKALESVLPMYRGNQYISIIAFTRSAELKINVYDYCNVVYVDDVVSRIFMYQDVILSEEQQNYYITQLQVFLNATNEEKIAHVQSVRQIINEREQIIETMKCPYCGNRLKTMKDNKGILYVCSNFPNCRFQMR